MIVFSSLHGADVREENVFLLSFPRSGSTWLRYGIEAITKRPTGETPFLFPPRIKKPGKPGILYSEKNRVILNSPLSNIFSELDVNFSLPPVIKIHNINQRSPKGENDFLIVVIRDYKECLLSHALRGSSISIEAIKKELTSSGWYLQVLETFDKWPQDRKLLLYYEDLVLEPEMTFQKLARFFQTDQKNVSAFITDLEAHCSNAMYIQQTYGDRSLSGGKSTNFHKKALPVEAQKSLDELCMENAPELTKKYLLRYQ